MDNNLDNDFVSKIEKIKNLHHSMKELNSKIEGVLEISCQSDKIISRIDNGTTNRF